MKPVRLEKSNNGEQVIYEARKMKKGKQYPIKWNGNFFMLMKNDKSVDLYKFYPD